MDMKLRRKIQKKSNKFVVIIILIILSSCLITLNFRIFSHKLDIHKNPKIPNNSGVWAKLNLNNYARNNTVHYHNETILIEGRLYNYVDENGINGYNVSVYVDGELLPDFNNITYNDGNFTIKNFTIPFDLAFYQNHTIKVNVTDELGNDFVELQNYYIFNLLPYANLTLTKSVNAEYAHNSTVQIQGRVYNSSNEAIGLSGLPVSIYVNGVWDSNFNNVTVSNGVFQINYTVPVDLEFQDYNIEVKASQASYWKNDIIPQNITIISIVPRARLTLTNTAFYNSRHYYGTTIPIEGKIYEFNDYSIGIPGISVALYIDGQLTAYNINTDSNGEFIINYIIPLDLDISQGHRVEVNVTQDIWINETIIVPPEYFTLYINATTILNITGFDSGLKVTGESFNIQGYLRYGNYLSGAGIPNVNINYFWYNSSFSWPIGFFTINVNGTFSKDLQIPSIVYSPTINLKIIYPGNTINIDSSQANISNIRLFSNITWIPDVVSDATEGTNITIAGQIISSNNDSLFISNRTLSILYDGVRVGSVNTDENGDFTFTYTLPEGTGNKSIQVELLNSAGITLDSIIVLNVTTEEFVADVSTAAPPFLIFSLVFFPILIGVIVGLAVYGYRRYKKQEKKSRVVTIVLDLKFLNLKILKESGRLEESLSYLFNAIFMTLIEAKYGRVREENETIRDFAIVSVKELKLTPAAIYPFIQKVEAIIYGTPFKIKENEFYKTCELFSPLYFELTGNNFILNF